MTKFARAQAARPVPRQAVRTAAVRSNRRRVDPAWFEFAEHVLVENFPLAAIAVAFSESAKTGRLPLRAVLLVAALAI